MLLIFCPYCAMARPEPEFRHAGQAHLLRPDPDTATDEAWTAYLHHRANPRGPADERWRHLHGCGRFFNARRDTATDEILATWPAGVPAP
jgi:sarcosine oxidase subunit delta